MDKEFKKNACLIDGRPYEFDVKLEDYRDMLGYYCIGFGLLIENGKVSKDSYYFYILDEDDYDVSD